MDMGDSFNGYANRPTWTVALWLDNCEVASAEMRTMAEETFAAVVETDEPERSLIARYHHSGRLQEYVENLCPAYAGATMEADLLRFVLAWVDWRELADNYLSEHVEEYER